MLTKESIPRQKTQSLLGTKVTIHLQDRMHLMPECSICRYKFHKEQKGDTTIITLIETKTQKEMGYVRFSVGDSIELEYIVANVIERGFGSKLVRVVKAIAQGLGKPIYLDSYVYSVGFWEKHDFIVLERRGDLVRMAWKAKTF